MLLVLPPVFLLVVVVVVVVAVVFLVLVVLVLLHDKAVEVAPLGEEGLHFNRLPELRSVVRLRRAHLSWGSRAKSS